MLQSTPLFSIVIANFNHGKFLEEAINSVLTQNEQDFELIIVDGGSTDNSLQIIEKYSNRISWWVSEKDNGQSDAFNKGFSKAIGQFFFWLNADDLLMPKSLEYAKNEINKYPNQLWFAANTIYFSEHGIIKKCVRGPNWRNFLLSNSPIYVYGPTSIFHRNIFETVGCFDVNLNYTMDSELWLRFKIKGFRFRRIHRYFWGFRIHENSKTSHTLSSKPNNVYLQEQEYIYNKHNTRNTKFGMRKQMIFKILFGYYLLSFIDSINLKGKNISKLK
ncbi:MAG: glycosyltransferase family 2 protein [Prolixibacteraceae bacterium]|jgi:glycosyltransferase involved in cell wall biosynthesis